MNHSCECSHSPAEHDTDDGWCGAELNILGELVPCICPQYTWGGND